MRHNLFGKQLSRSKNERRRLRQGLLRDLFIKGAIVTTKAKAQSIRALAEKLITKAKKGTDQKKREVYSELSEKNVVDILWARAKTQFKNRTSGFTRVYMLGQRRGDAAVTVSLSFVDEEIAEKEPKDTVKNSQGKKENTTSKVKKAAAEKVKKSVKK